nr:Gfo/Idh/MocA family oxidoreductase [Rhizobium leguminosarum]
MNACTHRSWFCRCSSGSAGGEPPGRLRHGCRSRPQGGGRLRRSRRRLRPDRVSARLDVDAVIIASPDFTHAPLSLSWIRAGKRALCEKPQISLEINDPVYWTMRFEKSNVKRFC